MQVWLVALLVEALKLAVRHVLLAIVSEAVLKELIIVALEKLAQKTKTDLDDKLVAKIRGQVQKQEETPPSA